MLDKQQESDNKENHIENDKEDTKQEKTNLERTVEVESDVDENHNETVEHLEVEDE